MSVSVPYTEICYSPDSWLVIAQLIKGDKLSLWLHHHTTNRAHELVTPIVSTGGLQETKLCASAMTASVLEWMILSLHLPDLQQLNHYSWTYGDQMLYEHT